VTETWVPQRSSTRAWVLYDLANTIFALGVVGLYFPEWLVVDQGRPDAHLAIAEAVAGAVVIVAAPFVGSRSDHRGKRLPALVLTTVAAVVATSLLARFPPLTSLILLGVALVAFNIGSVVYDALLPDVSPPGQRGRVSGLGVGLGYIGSFVGLGIGALTISRGYPAVFSALAAGFLVFAVPSFAFIRERPRPRAPGPPPTIDQVFTRLIESWKSTRQHRGLTRFLVGRFLYTDAINTLIGGFLAIFAQTELGLDSTGSRNLLATAIAFSILGGVIGARLVDRTGPLRYLRAVLLLWIGALLAGVVAAYTGWQPLVWLVGVAGGIALGGTWTSDRVAMVHLSPPERLGEYYGLYATVGRFATVLGPLTWTAVADLLGLGRKAALGALTLFVAAAWVVLRGVSDPEPPQEGLKSDSGGPRGQS